MVGSVDRLGPPQLIEHRAQMDTPHHQTRNGREGQMRFRAWLLILTVFLALCPRAMARDHSGEHHRNRNPPGSGSTGDYSSPSLPTLPTPAPSQNPAPATVAPQWPVDSPSAYPAVDIAADLLRKLGLDWIPGFGPSIRAYPWEQKQPFAGAVGSPSQGDAPQACSSEAIAADLLRKEGANLVPGFGPGRIIPSPGPPKAPPKPMSPSPPASPPSGYTPGPGDVAADLERKAHLDWVPGFGPRRGSRAR